MNATRAQSLVIVRILLAIVVVIAAGLWGMVSVFSDYPPQWSYARWALYVLGGHLLAGFFIGVLLPLRWRLSSSTAWGAILIGLMGVISMLTSSASNNGPTGPLLMPVGSLLVILATPAVAVLGGYAGSRLVTRAGH